MKQKERITLAIFFGVCFAFLIGFGLGQYSASKVINKECKKALQIVDELNEFSAFVDGIND